MNKNQFKNTINDNIKPDYYLKTRLKAKVISSKPNKTKKIFKPLIAASMCLVLVLGAFEFVPQIIEEHTPIDFIAPNPDFVNNSKGGVLIVQASQTDSILQSIDQFEVLTPMDYQIFVKDISSMTASQVDKANNEYPFGAMFYINTAEVSLNEPKNVLIRAVSSEYFDLDVDKPEEVAQIIVSNTNAYGTVEIIAQDVCYNDDGTSKNDGIDYTKSIYIQNMLPQFPEATLSGERFAKAKKLNVFGIRWLTSQALYDALDENPTMKLSTIKDTITFTVKYKNGDKAISQVEITFDDNGNMLAKNNGYEYIVKQKN